MKKKKFSLGMPLVYLLLIVLGINHYLPSHLGSDEFL